MKAIKQDKTSFHLSDWFQTPDSLIEVMRQVFNRRYADFYLDRGSHDAEEAIREVLLAFGKPSHILSHRRLVAMGYVMALAARSTFAYHKVHDGRIDMVLNHVKCWLKASTAEGGNGVNMAPQPANVVFFDADTVRGNDSIDDAYYLYFHLLNALQKESAYESSLEILYVSLLGDAISALPERRREVFNWWLTDVIPYAYHLQLPQAYYSGSWPFSTIVQPARTSGFYSSVNGSSEISREVSEVGASNLVSQVNGR